MGNKSAPPIFSPALSSHRRRDAQWEACALEVAVLDNKVGCEQCSQGRELLFAFSSQISFGIGRGMNAPSEHSEAKKGAALKATTPFWISEDVFRRHAPSGTVWFGL